MITKIYAGYLRTLAGDPLKKLVPGVAVYHEADIDSFGIILEVPLSSYVSVLWSTEIDEYLAYYDGPEEYDEEYYAECDCDHCIGYDRDDIKKIWRTDNAHLKRDDKRMWSSKKKQMHDSKR